MADKTITNLYTDNPISSLDGTEKSELVKSGSSGAVLESVRKAYILDGQPVTIKVNVTTGQILTGFTTPVQIVAAPGSGKMLVPVEIMFRLNFVSTAYAAANQNTIRWQGITTNAMTPATTILPATGNTLFIAQPSSVGFTLGSDNPVNGGLFFQVLGNDPTTGDSSIDVYITYIVITV